MLHRIREACGRGDFRLGNVVEAHETCNDGKRNNVSNAKRKALKASGTGRGAVGKDAVVGARGRAGRTIAKPVKRTGAATLVPFIEDSVNGKSAQVMLA